MRKKSDSATQEPKIITSCIHKGGTGKTTCSVHLVHRLVSKGYRTMLVDCDTQGNATSAFLDSGRFNDGGASALFIDDDGEVILLEGTDGVHVIPADDALMDIERAALGAESVFAENIKAIARDGEFDAVVIDTPPTIGFGMLAPLVASDFAFSPIVPDPYAISGVQSLLARVNQVKVGLNHDLEFLGLLVNRLNRRSRDQIRALDAMNEELSDFMIPHTIGERAAIGRVAFTGEPVWRGSRSSTAAREMRRAMDWIISEMAMEKSNG